MEKNKESAEVIGWFDAQAECWTDIYARRDAFSITYQDRMARVLTWVDGLRLPPGSDVLEVGCGAGFTTLALAEKGLHVQAQDVAMGMVEQTLRHATEAGLAERICVNLGDIHSLTFPDDSFPLALAIGVLPWCEDPSRALSELARVLRPEGYLLFTVDNRWRLHYLINPARTPLLEPLRALSRVLRKLFGWSAGGRLNRLHSIREVNSMLREADLEKVRGMTLGFGPFNFFRHRILSDSRGVKLHKTLQAWADRGVPLIRSAGGQYIVLARKPSVTTAPQL
ncbi:MAG: class I SAM-dependent methyltransferase [Candidatus Acidiferrales bacterium]